MSTSRSLLFSRSEVPRLEEVRLEALKPFVAQWALRLMPSRSSPRSQKGKGRVLLAVGPDGGWPAEEERR